MVCSLDGHRESKPLHAGLQDFPVQAKQGRFLTEENLTQFLFIMFKVRRLPVSRFNGSPVIFHPALSVVDKNFGYPRFAVFAGQRNGQGFNTVGTQHPASVAIGLLLKMLTLLELNLIATYRQGEPRDGRKIVKFDQDRRHATNIPLCLSPAWTGASH